MASLTLDRKTNYAAFFVGAGVLVAALAVDMLSELPPSDFVQQQRYAFVVGVALAGAVVATRDFLARAAWFALALAACGVFAWAAYLSWYQVGIQVGLWPNPFACGVDGRDVDLSSLALDTPSSAVSCGTLEGSLFGLPFSPIAGTASLFIIWLIGASVARRVSAGSLGR